MGHHRKPRSDSTLKTLPLDRQYEIYTHARTKGYEATVKWLRRAGIKTSATTLGLFWSWFTSTQLVQDVVEEHEELLRKAHRDWTPERIREAGMSKFQRLAIGKEDQKAFVDVTRLDLAEREAQAWRKLEERKLRIAERRIKVLEEKAAQADEARVALASPLTEEEKQKKMREIFGMI